MSIIQSPCFISDSRTCQASNLKDIVFIIGSGSREFKEDINVIIEVLDGFNLTGYFALLSEKEKGLDAFCDKICSKIRKSRFCVVMLNDSVIKNRDGQTRDILESIRAPSANVYYEFGIAIALEKPVIPVIRSDLNLPFDVQHLDAIIYKDLSDLRKKLKHSVLPTLTKKKKEFRTTNSKLIEHIYAPLYNEISSFLSKCDKFTTFNPSRYQRILVNSRHRFDIIDKNLQEEIETFYSKLKEFNSFVKTAKGIIQKIVSEQLCDFFDIPYTISLSLHINLDTDDGQTSPTLNQILIRKTTPERYFETQGVIRRIRKIRYIMEYSDNRRREIDSETFKTIFDLCRKRVERNDDIVKMRELEETLRINGEALKKKLIQLCNQ